MTFRHLLAGAALTFMLVSPAGAQAPLPPVTAPSGPVQSAGPNGSAPPAPGHHGPRRLLAEIGTTPQQRAQLRPMLKAMRQQQKQVRQATRSQIQGILSPQQAAQLADLQAQARQEHHPLRPRQVAAQLGLNPQQTQQMRAIRQAVRRQQQDIRQQFLSQTSPILTPDQQAALADRLTPHRRTPR